MRDDPTLLREFAECRSESAFAELVRRHINAVYSAALRRVGGDTHLAEDVTQQVFAALAQKASTVTRHPQLSAWLYVTTRNEAAGAVRAERRRKNREQEAAVMNDAFEGTVDWQRIAPVIDGAIDQLSDRDRAAVLLRFVENRPFAEIGAALRVSEDAARMRVDRALDRLQAALKRRGIESSAAALGLALSTEVVHAAPTALAASVVTTSITVPAAGSSAAAALIQLMTTTKVGVTAATAVLLVSLGSATYEYRAHTEAKAALAAATAETQRTQARLTAAETARTATARQANALERQLKEQKPITPARSASVTAASKAADPQDPASVGAAFLAAHPEVRAALVRFVDSQTDSNFGALYRELKMTDAEIDRFRGLLRETCGYSQYLGQTSQLVQFSLSTGLGQAEAWNGVRTLLGETRFQRTMEYMADLPARQLAESLTGAFVFTDPLTSDQTRQLQEVVKAARGKGDFNQFDWGLLATQASAFLTPQQMEVLTGVRVQKEYNQSVSEAATARQAAN